MSWFVRNVREMKWWDRGARGSVADLVGDDDAQVGVNLFVLGPGEPMSMYHWEADQEGFLVLSGEALLIVENEERPLRQWDYFHCPPDVLAHDRRCRFGAVGDPCHRRAGASGRPRLGRLSVSERRDESTTRASREATNDAEGGVRALSGRAEGEFREGWLP